MPKFVGQVFFVKGWEENKLYAISKQDLIDGNLDEFYEYKSIKFPSEIEYAALDYCGIFPFEDRLIFRGEIDDNTKTKICFYDSKGNKI